MNERERTVDAGWATSHKLVPQTPRHQPAPQQWSTRPLTTPDNPRPRRRWHHNILKAFHILALVFTFLHSSNFYMSQPGDCTLSPSQWSTSSCRENYVFCNQLSRVIYGLVSFQVIHICIPRTENSAKMLSICPLKLWIFSKYAPCPKGVQWHTPTLKI